MGRKRSHNDSIQLTDKQAVSHSSSDVIVESALRSKVELLHPLHCAVQFTCMTVKRRRKCLLQSARSSWYRLENENGDEKICGHAKNRESRRRQRQSGAAENRAAGLTARRCDVGLKWT